MKCEKCDSRSVTIYDEELSDETIDLICQCDNCDYAWIRIYKYETDVKY